MGRTLADRMRRHAGTSEHLYGHLGRAMAADWDSGGPVRDICRGWDDAPEGSVVQLRLLGGLFRIVLTGRAPQLVQFYPCLGGDAPPDQAWPVVRAVLAAHRDELHEALEVAPQTNEVGRSTALLVGIFEAVRRTGLRRLRLLEPGASGGLNLLVDRFRFVNPAWAFGPDDSLLRLVDGVIGHVDPEPFEVVERRGCDLSPVDVTSPEGQLRLRSFVWPFHLPRHERLTHALEVAQHDPPRVDAAPAGEWLELQLARPVEEGVLTVVWHSITRQYWPAAEMQRVASAIRKASTDMPIAHVAMEFPPGSPTAQLMFELPGLAGGGGRGPEHLADVGDHGPPVTLVPGRA